MRFTDRYIASLKPKAVRYEKTASDGLRIRVSPNGGKTWLYVYRLNDKVRRLKLGTYPTTSVAEAHRLHADARAAKENGVDPAQRKQDAKREERAAITVAGLASEYIERHAKPRKRSWAEDQRILHADVLPRWGKRKARDISRADVIALLDAIVDRGAPIAANRTLAVVRRMYRFAVERALVEQSPCTNVSTPASERRRDRVLNAEEIRALWHALPQAPMSEGVEIALKLQLVTAQRKGELAGMRWDELDLAERWWTIPGERAKNGLPHRVPLSDVAIELLEQAKPIAQALESPWVFPSPRRDENGNARPISATAINHAVHKTRDVLGIGEWTPHDLRRSAASHMTGMGISRLVVSKVLNHAESGVTAVYDRHSYDDEKRSALDHWAARLRALTAESGRVVSMRRA